MNYFPNEQEKLNNVTIPLSYYLSMKDRIVQLELFKNDKCYYKEIYNNYTYTKYYSFSENKLLEELNEEIKLHSKATNNYMIERNKYFNELKKIKKSIFYKIFKFFII